MSKGKEPTPASQFMYHHVWEILRDQPKWKEQTCMVGSQSHSSKRSFENISSDANTFDLNDDNDVSVVDYNFNVEELPHPIGTKKAKAMAKAKKAKFKNKGGSSKTEDAMERFQHFSDLKISTYDDIKTQMREYVDIKRKENELREYEILFKDTSLMTPEQLAIHKICCDKIRAKYGI
ncbi:uncharacterized protein LOC118491297 [Helianthus annuus]|uniref:uncharacterized protein LOC118491297 n=1 Tax=Helianthus annuus TaxID=4232 RepID=UPI0016532B96|nr:uncharacterized protein LOC118491297 [Helianthus annuus]